MRSGRLLVILLVLLAPRTAAASAIHVVIDDFDVLYASFYSGSGTIDVSLLPPFTVDQPGIGEFGEADNQFEYLSVSGGLPAPGSSLTQNYNIFENSELTTLASTLALTFTGRAPTPGNDANVVVNVHYRSASLDGMPPAALADAIDVFALQDLELINALHRKYLRLMGPLGDFEVDVAVPEPGTATLLGFATVSALWRHLRKRGPVRKEESA